MANYQSNYTGEQIDEAVGKALAIEGGYEETVVNKLVDFVVPAGQGGSYGTELTVNDFPEIVPGDTYLVTVNGEPFTIVAITSGGDPCLGQQRFDDTSSPCFSIVAYSGIAKVIAHDPNGLTDTVDRHIVIETRETVTHTIEPKFLPGVCLPVIEVENTSVTALTDAQNEVLMAAAQVGVPVVLRINNANRGRGSYVLYLEAYSDTGNIRYFANLNGQYYSGYVWLDSTYTDGQRNGFIMTFSAGA